MSLISERDINQFHEQGYFVTDVAFESSELQAMTDEMDRVYAEGIEAAKKTGRVGVDISYKTMEKLMRHTWPGNVRELKNFIERAVLLTEPPQIGQEDLRLGELTTGTGA